MPQGNRYDAEGNLLWKFDICIEFDCSEKFAKVDCKCDFTKKPCLFLAQHEELNLQLRPHPHEYMTNGLIVNLVKGRE